MKLPTELKACFHCGKKMPEDLMDVCDNPNCRAGEDDWFCRSCLVNLLDENGVPVMRYCLPCDYR